MSYISLSLCKIAVSVIAALSLYLCSVLCGQLSLGHAGFMALGAYFYAFFDSVHLHGAPVLSALAVFLLVYPLGFVLLRISGDFLAAATLGLAELVRIALSNFTLLGGSGGYSGIFRINAPTAVLCALAAWLFAELFSKTKYGRFCRAVSSDETAAIACGVHTLRLKTAVFALSAGMCALSGCIYAGAVGFICPNDFGFTRSTETLAAVMLGGRKPAGAVLAAIAFELLSALLQGFAEIKMLVYGAVLLALCLIKRRG